VLAGYGTLSLEARAPSSKEGEVMAKRKEPLFHRAHYNAIAKEIREPLKIEMDFYTPEFESMRKERKARYYAVAALVNLALSFAKRFKEDNPKFDPLKFLDACSPDPDIYPISELWED
jgi:hypothetical protein